MSIIQDVTEQKSAAVIVDAMHKSFFELDENLAFRRINEHASKFWQLGHQEFAGKNLTTVLPQSMEQISTIYYRKHWQKRTHIWEVITLSPGIG